MTELSREVKGPGRIYFTGGASALLLGFRDQTIDVDIKIDPEPLGIFEAIAELKRRLNVNIELAAPDDFIPVSPDWRDRSVPLGSSGPIEFFHFAFVAQALAKIERGHRHDLDDVRQFVSHGLTSIAELVAEFERIRPLLVRYPALDEEAFARKLRECVESLKRE